jgi:fatty acid desaturase
MPAWNEKYSDVSNAASANARRVFVVIGRQPNFFIRFLTFLIAAVIFGLMLLIILPILVIGALGLGALWLYVWVRLKFARWREPNGPLDRRHNVRVIDRDDQGKRQ